MRTKIIILIALILIGGMNLYAQNGKTLIAYSVGVATRSMWQSILPDRPAAHFSVSIR